MICSGDSRGLRRLAHLVAVSSAGSDMFQQDGVKYRIITNDKGFYCLQAKLLDDIDSDFETVLCSSEPFA